jgi:hypothetical protein
MQNFNSFNSLASANGEQPLQSQMSVFNALSSDQKIEIWNDLGEATGNITRAMDKLEKMDKDAYERLGQTAQVAYDGIKKLELAVKKIPYTPEDAYME